MTDEFIFCDELGPDKVVEIYDPRTRLRAMVVIDNVALGPSIGGIRMAADVTLEECFRLARAMTLKNSAAGLPHGGGKSVICADPGLPAPEKERLVRSFAAGIRDLRDYIPGPDMGTNEAAMVWVRDEIGRAAGLPREAGGIPLDEIGATGLGVAAAVDVAQDFCDLNLDGARIAVQGFGAVGQHAARYLAAKGARLVAASDSRGTCRNPGGLDVDALIDFKRAGNRLADFAGGEAAPGDALLDVECEVWIPAARPDVLTADNVGRLKALVVAEGANIPATREAERLLAERGVLVLPDFIANAGGVICAAAEIAGGTEADARRIIEDKIRANTREMLSAARASGQLPREAALAMARARVLDAMP